MHLCETYLYTYKKLCARKENKYKNREPVERAAESSDQCTIEEADNNGLREEGMGTKTAD